MDTSVSNDLIQLYSLRYDSNNQMSILRKDLHIQFYGTYYDHIDQTAYTYA